MARGVVCNCWQFVGFTFDGMSAGPTDDSRLLQAPFRLPPACPPACLLSFMAYSMHARCINLNKSDIAFSLVQLQMPPKRRCAMSTCSSNHRQCDVDSRWRCAVSISWMVRRSIRLSSIADSWSFIALRPASTRTPRSSNIPVSKWT